MRLSICLLSLLLLAPACGGGAADPASLTSTAYQELGAGDLKAAEGHFAEALTSIGGDTTHPQYLRAKLGRIEALAQMEGHAGEAKDEFLALASQLEGKVTDRHFNQIGGRLGDARAFAEATEVLEAGQAAYPDSPHLAGLLDELGKRAEASGDVAALEALKGLGYVGD